jgi:hypothetical protein
LKQERRRERECGGNGDGPLCSKKQREEEEKRLAKAKQREDDQSFLENLKAKRRRKSI